MPNTAPGGAGRRARLREPGGTGAAGQRGREGRPDGEWLDVEREPKRKNTWNERLLPEGGAYWVPLEKEHFKLHVAGVFLLRTRLTVKGSGGIFCVFSDFRLGDFVPLSLSLVLCHWLRASKICGPKVWKGHVNHVVSGLMNVQRPIGLCQDPPRSVYLLCTIFAAYNRWTRKHNPWRLQCSCPRQDEFAACEERVEGQFRDQINALQSQVWGPCNGGLSQDEGGVGS